MTYSVNGVALTLQPTGGRWEPRQLLGTTGDGHPVYSGVRNFQLTWNAISPAEYYQLQNFFAAVATTGTAVVGLPQYGAATYTFYNYSGCALREPETSNYFAENLLSARLIINNITT